MRPLTPARRVPLVGRDTQTARLGAVLTDVGSGEGRCVAITGAAGMGKTRLLEQTRDQALRAGFAHRGIEFPRLSAPPLQVLTTMFPQMAAPKAPVDGVEGLAVAGVNALAFTYAEAVLDQIEDLTAARPLILSCDDLHWADEATIRVLGMIGPRLRHLPVLLLASWREEEGAAASLLPAWGSVGVQVAANLLTSAEATRLAAARLGRDPSKELGSELEVAGGNPLLVNEVLDGLVSEGRVGSDGTVVPGVAAGVPAAVRRRIAAQVASLGAGGAEAVVVAALLGGTIDVARLALVLDWQVPRVTLALQEVVSSGLVVDDGQELRFRHDVVAQTVIEGLSPALAASLRDDTAKRLRQTGLASASAIAALQRGGRDGPATSDEVDREMEAAVREIPLTPQTVARRLSELLPRCHTTRTATPVRRALMRALAYAGRFSEAEAVLSELTDTGMAEAEVSGQDGDRVLHAELLFLQGRLDAAAALFEDAARDGVCADKPLRLADAAMSRLLVGGLADAERLARAALDDPNGPGSRGAVHANGVLSWAAALRLDLPGATRHGTRAVSGAGRDPACHAEMPLLVLGQVHAWTHDAEAATRAYRRGRTVARSHGLAWHEPLYAALTADALLSAGHTDDAFSEANAAVSYARDVTHGLGGPWAFVVLADIHRMRGDLKLAADLLVEAEAMMARGAAQGADLVILARVRLLRDQGAERSAAELLVMLWHRLLEVGALLRVAEQLLDGRGLAFVSGSTALADVASAGAALIAKHAAPDSWPAAVARLDGALASRDPDAADHAARALRRRTAHHVMRAQAAHQLALCHARHGEHDTAGRRGRAAVRAWMAIGASGEARRLAAELARSDVRVRVPAVTRGSATALTPSQRTVVRAVAEGLGNGEIAAELGVSRRTVESHLYQVFTNVGVKNRTELAAWAIRSGVI